MSGSNDLSMLFADYARGEISAEQLQALELALRINAELRREFVEYMNIDSALGDLAALTDAEMAEIELAVNQVQCTTITPSNSTSFASAATASRRTYRVAYVSGAIAFTLLVGAILWNTDSHPSKDAPLAMLVDEVDATLIHGGASWKIAELPGGEYRLIQGLLRLQFAHGVMVCVEGPAQFHVVDKQRIKLLAGRISANVPKEGIGFTVETSEASIVDHGTVFSVEAESGASEVHVFEGLVRVQSMLGGNDKTGAIDLRTSQAIRIENSQPQPVAIKLANERFVRNFDEPKRNYARTVKQLSPVAFYRMAIRDKGLVSEPPQYSGIVLTGDGIRPPHARGVFAGGSLRVGTNSTGRGGRVDSPPPLGTGRFTLAVYLYLEARSHGATVATNLQADGGNFALTLDEKGSLRATVRQRDGELRSVSNEALFPLTTWRHLVVTSDGDQLRLYEDGHLVASTPCAMLAPSVSETVWFGTDAKGIRLWGGRIDELALFARAVSADEIADLYQAAQQEIAELARD